MQAKLPKEACTIYSKTFFELYVHFLAARVYDCLVNVAEAEATAGMKRSNCVASLVSKVPKVCEAVEQVKKKYH